MGSARLSRGLVSLAASAITAVYVAGYVHTQAADSLLEPVPTDLVSVQTTQTLAPVVVSTQAGSPAASAAHVIATATPLLITDRAVEQYADQHHVSWDEARSKMRAAGGIEVGPTQGATSTTAPVVAGPAGAAATAATPPRAGAVAAPPVGAATAVITSRSGASAPALPTVTPRPTPTPTAVVRSAAAEPAATRVSSVSSQFKDGTYSGQGTSRRGDVQVSVAIQSGRISSVAITAATTQYPTRLIAGLPAQVVSRQSAQVDSVSGATFSSLAFRSAVLQALQRAQS